MFNSKNEEVIYLEKEGIKYIQFKKLLKYGVKHAYTLKSNGIDFAFDQDKNLYSYEKLCKVLEIDSKSVVQPVQTHTDTVKCIDRVESIENLKNVDGLITDKPGIALTTKNADCILFIFYDPINKVIANVHSGWRGTFQKISEKAVQKMINFYGSKPENILCFISPSIRKDHFEVDNDVRDLCEEIFGFTGRTEEFIEIGEVKDGVQKYYIDTVLINKILLTNMGLKSKNIIDCNICSACNGDKIESVRVDGDLAKRATMLVIL